MMDELVNKMFGLEVKDGVDYFYLHRFDGYENFESIALYLEKTIKAHLVSSDLGIFTAKHQFSISDEQFILEYHEDIGICFYSLSKKNTILKSILLDLNNRLSALM